MPILGLPILGQVFFAEFAEPKADAIFESEISENSRIEKFKTKRRKLPKNIKYNKNIVK